MDETASEAFMHVTASDAFLQHIFFGLAKTVDFSGKLCYNTLCVQFPDPETCEASAVGTTDKEKDGQIP